MADSREAFVQVFCGVFFQVKPRDAYAFLRAIMVDFKPAIRGEGQFVLGDLIAFGQIGIEIVLASEAGMFMDGAIQGERGAHG